MSRFRTMSLNGHDSDFFSLPMETRKRQENQALNMYGMKINHPAGGDTSVHTSPIFTIAYRGVQSKVII